VTSRRAAFLDRDGVLNERPAEHEYVTDPDALVVLEGAREAVALLRQHGYVPIVVSNQRGVARGLISEAVLQEIEERIRVAGVEVDHFYYCPHDFEDGCSCRKPKPGMLLSAARDLNLSLRDSVMIGDSEADVGAGQSAGCRTIRVSPAGVVTTADFTSRHILEAAMLVVDLAQTRTDST
jgi:D-glycero-D-manno-heptose 1,7-bisphosphate phosphatase